jgi:predicted transcriptional regulator
MAIDTATVHLLSSALGSPVARKLFTTIAKSRIAEIASLKETNPGADQALDTLERADLISIGQSGKSYFVTAKGLKVARDLEQLANV